MFNSRTLFAIAITAFFVGSAQADAVIGDVLTSGSGCPGGSGVSSQTNANLVTMSTAPDFRVSMGLGGNPEVKNKNCLVSIQVTVGPNEQFTVTQSPFPAWARLDAGTSLAIISTFSFQSNPGPNHHSRMDYSGDQYLAGAPISYAPANVGSDIWSPCGQPDAVFVNYRIALNGQGTAEAAGLVDPGQNILITTRPC